MVFNHVTDRLRLWCSFSAGAYPAQSALHRLSRRLICALEEELCSLTDQNFPDYAAYLRAASKIAVSCADRFPEEGRAAQYCLAKIISSFDEHLHAQDGASPAPLCAYRRLIQGEEAHALLDRLCTAWNFSGNYWYPLDGTPHDGRLYLPASCAEPYWDEIARLIGLPEVHIYELTECSFAQNRLFESSCIKSCACSEAVYGAMDFSWLIYFSHEGTVSFAGNIVSEIKQVLSSEETHWYRIDTVNL